jgi:hypothetical protein
MIRVRTPTSADAAGMAQLLGELGYPTAPDALPARLTAIESGGGCAFLAVTADDRPIGLACVTTLASLHVDAPVCYITALVTATDARGQGVGPPGG